nr:hypothetical protein [Pandoravirus massiliensis]
MFLSLCFPWSFFQKKVERKCLGKKEEKQEKEKNILLWCWAGRFAGRANARAKMLALLGAPQPIEGLANRPNQNRNKKIRSHRRCGGRKAEPTRRQWTRRDASP